MPMIVRLGGLTAAALVVFAGFAAAADAQSPRPSPSAVPTPSGFAAHAHANVTVAAQGTTYDGSAQLAVAQRDLQTRLDVVSVKSSALPIPPISFTAVIDRRANTLTVWNDATKQYRSQPFLPRASASPTAQPRASPRPSPAPRATVRRTSPLKNLDVLDLSLKLTGHTTTVGLPTTGLAFELNVRNKNDRATSHITATTQLADDYAVFPVTLELSIEPGMVAYSGKLSYAVDDLTPGAPPANRFAVPPGYTEARSLMSVILGR
jgi:hypothetical protein